MLGCRRKLNESSASVSATTSSALRLHLRLRPSPHSPVRRAPSLQPHCASSQWGYVNYNPSLFPLVGSFDQFAPIFAFPWQLVPEPSSIWMLIEAADATAASAAAADAGSSISSTATAAAAASSQQIDSDASDNYARFLLKRPSINDEH